MKSSISVIFPFLVLPASSLRLNRETERCTNIPENLAWGVYIDGKDAQKGPDAYAWDPDFLTNPKITVQFLHDTVAVGSMENLTTHVVDSIHKTCCKRHSMRNGTHSGHTLDCVSSIEKCEFRMRGASNIKAGYIKFIGEPDAQGCYKSYTRGNPLPVKKHMKELFAEYNEKVHAAGSDQEKINVLANMLRNFAWLHSYNGANGRMKNFILQREIRRLGLGCGAFMYNNNRDIFFIDDAIYARRIREGIQKYRDSVALGKNVWEVQENQDRHLRDFAYDKQMEDVCLMREKLGSIY